MAKTKETFEERSQRQKREWLAKRKAAETARQRLEAEGVQFPIYRAGEDMTAYHVRLQAYSEKETAYALEAFRQPSGPRPVIEFKKEWEPYKDA